MINYAKPTERFDHVDHDFDMCIVHVGTNDLPSHKSPEQMFEEVFNLAESLKLRNNTVVVSNIVLRNVLHKKKPQEVGTTYEKQ